MGGEGEGGEEFVQAGRQREGFCLCASVRGCMCACVCVWVGEGSVLYITHLCSDSPLVVVHCEIF